MFRTSSAAAVLGRRAGRIAFGVVMIAGAMGTWWGSGHRVDPLALLGFVTGDGEVHAARMFVVTWLAAIACALLVRLIVWLAAPAPRGDALLSPSLVVPAAGLALMLPLTLHMLVMHGGIDEWVRESIAVVGLAHVVFAVLFAARAAGLAKTATPRVSIGAIFLWSVLASFVPWPFIIPQLLTGITGVFLLPVLFGFDYIAERERTALPLVPRAQVR